MNFLQFTENFNKERILKTLRNIRETQDGKFIIEWLKYSLSDEEVRGDTELNDTLKSMGQGRRQILRELTYLASEAEKNLDELKTSEKQKQEKVNPYIS